MTKKMKRRKILKNSLLVSAGLSFGVNAFSANIANNKKQPNIVFFFCDDLGMHDLGCYGSTAYETPNLDKFASDNVKFTNAYSAAPSCAPTRGSLFTGRNPARLYKTTVMNYHTKGSYVKLIGGKRHPKANAEPGILFPTILKQNGYQTAMVGKWHTYGKDNSKNSDGGLNKELTGFDYAYRTGGHVHSFFPPYMRNTPKWIDAKPNEYLTDHLTDKAISYLDSTKRDKPFFLYLGHNAPHTPIEAKEEDIKYFEKKWGLTGRGKTEANQYYNQLPTKSVRYEDHIIKAFGKIAIRTKQDNPIYAAMLKSVDESFERVCEKLDDMGVSDNTIVIFYSDNGGYSITGVSSRLPKKDKKTGELRLPKPGPTSNVPFKGGKSNLYEGGVREPLLIKYPNSKKENFICDVPINTPDFYPTFLEMAGIPLMPEQHKDGNSFVNLFNGKDGLVNYERPLYWHYPHNTGGYPMLSVIRKGDFKLVKQWYLDTVELYNLKEDIGQLNDISEKYSEKTKELHKMLIHWLDEEVYAERIVLNPEYKE